jgi:hypothetical protein
MRLLVQACTNLLIRQAPILRNVWIVWTEKFVLAVQKRAIVTVDIGAVTAFQSTHVNAVGPGQARMRIAIEVRVPKPGYGPAFVGELKKIPIDWAAYRDRPAVLVQLQ